MPKNAINQKKSIFSKVHDEKTFLGINCCSTYKNLSNDTKVGRGYHTSIYNFIWERWYAPYYIPYFLSTSFEQEMAQNQKFPSKLICLWHFPFPLRVYILVLAWPIFYIYVQCTYNTLHIHLHSDYTQIAEFRF